MSHRLKCLLLCVLGCILAGFVASPFCGLFLRIPGISSAPSGDGSTADSDKKETAGTDEVKDQGKKPGATKDNQSGLADEDGGDDGTDEGATDDDDGWGQDDDSYVTESEDPNAFMQDDDPAELLPHLEDEVDADPKYAGVEKATETARLNTAARNAAKLATKFAKQESADRKRKYTTGFRSEDISKEDWKHPEKVYETLCTRVLAKLGKCDDEAVMKFLEAPANRLDLARLTLIRKVGVDSMRRVAEQKMGTTFLYALTSDLDWMTGTLFSGPTANEAKGLSYMANIYAEHSEELTSPVARRIAATAAMEFAREGYSQQQALERYRYYYTSYKQGRLNKIFDDLQYWECRIVCGCREPEGWGSPVSLAWQRDNVRLPVQGYLGACNQLVYRLRNVAGDSVFSGDYLAPVLKHMKHATAWAYREIGGVCGACSHYGAYGALASGIPAMTMGEPGHCAYVVRVGNEWKMSYSIYWQHGMHKAFWGMHDWDFLILTQDLYQDRYRTQVSDFYVAVGQFLAARKMEKPAMHVFEIAAAVQPLNWPAWVAYASYVKQKSPKDLTHWRSINDRIVSSMNVKFHNAAATFLTIYVYPNMLPLLKDKGERHKVFVEFFKKCDNFGTNRWDITKFLNVQMAACRDGKEQVAYMKETLKLLMAKPDYSGAVVAWSLQYAAGLSSGDGKKSDETAKLQDEFSEIIIKTLSRASTGKKQEEQSWAALGEACNAASENADIRTFQAIGKLASRKFRHRFSRKRLKFRPLPGKLISSDGLINTAVTLTSGQVQNSCMHWAALQPTGGSIPVKLSGKDAHMKVTLTRQNEISGAVIIFNRALPKDKKFHLEVSQDGRNWSELRAHVEISGSTLRVDSHKAAMVGRYVRLSRDGGKFEDINIVGFYVYGRPVKSRGGK